MTFDLSFANGQSVSVNDGNNTFDLELHNAYLLAFEDLPWNANNEKLGDDDFDDTMYVVMGVRPVPEPASVAVWCLLGIAGGIVVRWRRR